MALVPTIGGSEGEKKKNRTHQQETLTSTSKKTSRRKNRRISQYYTTMFGRYCWLPRIFCRFQWQRLEWCTSRCVVLCRSSLSKLFRTAIWRCSHAGLACLPLQLEEKRGAVLVTAVGKKQKSKQTAGICIADKRSRGAVGEITSFAVSNCGSLDCVLLRALATTASLGTI